MEGGEFDRIKREECKRTKHDSLFSKWKVLVGPSDWEDYSLGKEGAARYRVQNLPTSAGPGLYELAVAVPRKGLGRELDKLDSDGVAVVYLGQADSVRTRLQCYGRNGAHLNKPNDSGLKNGPGYFEDIFSRGFSIVYRWVPMENKAIALKTENQLLDKLDYAWNKGSNGKRRHDDVLRKLNKIASSNIQLPKPVRKLLYFSQKPVGIKIEGIKLLPPGNKFSGYPDEDSYNLFPQVFKFSKSKLRLVSDRHGAGEVNTGACGVSLGDGSICRSRPVEGNKRCDEHKWRKAYGSSSKSAGTSQDLPSAVIDSSASNALHCDETKPGRVQPKASLERPVVNRQYDTLCGVELGNGCVCIREPVTGRVRCEEHKGLKVSGLISNSAAKDRLNGDDKCSNFSTSNDMKYRNSVCGALTLSGSYCKMPVKGNARCWQHSVDTHSTASAYDDGKSGGASFCGALTLCGSYCQRPVKGNVRCWQHSVDTHSTAGAYDDLKSGGTSVCGAVTHGGSYCKRPVKGNARCWQHSVDTHSTDGTYYDWKLGGTYWQHSVDMRSTVSRYDDWNSGGSSICGAPTRNGSYCRRTVKGGGTCWQH
ncbi:protein EFFECTOR OF TRANSCRIPTION 2-like [Mangifera indica]|uniref:protein EFFECTOR OF TRANSCRIPTION 2-like n=1 Tax=Mangifera indica TaxID=29780 RepID=UPI001CFABDCB|nr:protein EFFECTOR OF TRANSCRIPTION 2-like [Mangifera indica]